MVRIRLALAIGMALLLSQANLASADLVVSQWSLSSIVYAENDIDGEGTNVVQNPYFNVIHAQSGNSYADTLYDMSWSGDAAAFNIVIDHFMTQLDGRVGSGGQIYFTPGIDSTLTLSARYNYDWPTSVLGQAALTILIADFTANENIYNQGRQGGNVGLDPPHGTLTLPVEALNLFAGHNYKIHCGAFTDQFNAGPPGTSGASSGEIHFSLTPVPEPATLGPLAAGFLLARRRHPQRSRRL